jgi:hypothetical protein
MVSLASLRDKVANKVFTADIKSSAVLSSLTSASTDKWGDEQSSYSAGTNIDVVPFTNVSKELSYQPFGDLQSGQSDFVIPYTVTVNPTDRITWQGDNYFVELIDKTPWIGGGLVVNIVRARREA